eukprot:gene3998-4628_t
MEKVLDFSAPLDINLLDNIVRVMYFSTNNQERASASKVLQTFQDHPDSWTKVDGILEYSNSPETKFYALLILESLIKYKWKALPRDQCDGIKNYIVALIIRLSSDAQTFVREKQLLNKLNIIFVQILKKEWPHHWSSFIPEIVQSSRSNETLCENNMNILKILSEEIFNFSEEQMTQSKIQDLKIGFEKEFSLINELCQFILENATRPSLIKATLETLQRFLSWIPLHYIIQTNLPTPEPSQLVKLLLYKYFPEPAFRNATLRCLGEIGSFVLGAEYDGVFVHIIDQFMNKLKFIKPDPSKIPSDYEDGNQQEQDFIHGLTIFLTGFFKAHLKIMENTLNIPYLTLGHEILIQCSNVEDIEIFKICLEYWNSLSSNLYNDSSSYTLLAAPPRLLLYKSILSKVRVVLINRMAKPEEVIVVEDENGNIIRELTKDTDSLTLYESMRETLIFLTNLDAENTQSIMLEKLNLLVSGFEWSFAKINTLCWAIGSISGAQNKDQEKRFLVTVIKDLLELCQVKRGKDNKAAIASDIMYIVGQYPRFLKDHWKFLKTVVNKLFEFMHESHPGVQDMACDTFLKIAKQCKRKFVILQVDETQPFINELLTQLPNTISDLEPSQVHTFYEAVGFMISSSTDPSTREKLVMRFMDLPNQSWQMIMSKAASNVESILNLDVTRNMVNLLKTNNRAAMSLGPCFLVQMTKIYLDLLNVYRTYSDFISKNPAHIRSSLGMGMKSVKKETLKLLETFIDKSDDKLMIHRNFIQPLLEAVLGDYQTNVPETRDPEVLSLMAVIIGSLKSHINPEVPKILESVFECTLGMITKNFEDYPYHRINFFNLIRVINANAFSVFHSLSPQQFKLLIDCVVWALKHTERNISETGLNILKELIDNVSKSQDISNAFFKTYLMSLVTDILYILTDSFHKSGFNLQCDILRMMIQVVENGIVKVPLWDAATVTDPNMNNSIFLRDMIVNFLSSSPNVQRPQIQSMTSRLFATVNTSGNEFKISVRDFLIHLKEFQGSDNVELFSDEKEAEKQAALKRAQAIPGMIRPNENEEMMD